MAPLEVLLPLIYHERQQEGSMLCAQHALNNLFRTSYFSPRIWSADGKIRRQKVHMLVFDPLHALQYS